MTEIFDELEQGTEEWFEVRKGLMTASNASRIGPNGQGLMTYCKKIVDELFSEEEPERFSNEHTDRGNELEPVAKAAYELIKKVKVKEIGFAKYNDYVGCSPDGLVGGDGLIEIKSPADKGYEKFLKDGKINTNYVWQIQHQLLVMDREWCDYVVFNPNFKESIQIVRVEADPIKQFKLMKGFKKGEDEIKRLTKEKQKCLTEKK